MKKIFGLLLIFVFLVSIAGIGFAQVGKKKADLEKVKKYIVLLDRKIKKARAAKHINKIAELKDLKRKALGRAKRLRVEIARSERGRGAKAGLRTKSRFQAGLGYGGGAGILGVGYIIPLGRLGLLIDAGYGMGNQYSVVTVSLSGILPFGANYAGLALGVANYSKTVTDIPGLSGNIEKGSKTGFGIFVGRAFGRIRAQIGYNSALGLTAGAIYKF